MNDKGTGATSTPTSTPTTTSTTSTLTSTTSTTTASSGIDERMSSTGSAMPSRDAVRRDIIQRLDRFWPHADSESNGMKSSTSTSSSSSIGSSSSSSSSSSASFDGDSDGSGGSSRDGHVYLSRPLSQLITDIAPFFPLTQDTLIDILRHNIVHIMGRSQRSRGEVAGVSVDEPVLRYLTSPRFIKYVKYSLSGIYIYVNICVCLYKYICIHMYMCTDASRSMVAAALGGRSLTKRGGCIYLTYI
jgi:hypothetical protein